MLKILTNTAGENATVANYVDGATASGYDDYDLISGPRNRSGRSQASTGHISFAYAFGVDVEADHMVVARADKMLTLSSLDMVIRERNSSNVWADVSSTALSPIQESHLIGIHEQDYVKQFTPTVQRGYALRVKTNSADAEALMLSKLYFAKGFSFGVEPEKPLQEDDLTEIEEILPPGGKLPYAIEKRITLIFKSVTRAKVDEFLALPQIFNWPFFLYDDTASDIALWQHRLEHVVVESCRETWQRRSDVNLWDIELTLGRLAHNNDE